MQLGLEVNAMSHVKEIAKTAVIALVVVAAYHNGFLNWTGPVFGGAKKA